MQIKVCRIEDGPARVEVIDPESGETVSCTDVNVGQEVTLEAEGAVSSGEVTASAETTEEPGGEEAEQTGEPGGEGSGTPGDGE